jgi:hypothetical protein
MHSQPRYQMEVCGHYHTLATKRLSGRKPLLSIEYRLGGSQSHFGPFRDEKNLLSLPGIKPLIVQPMA